MTTATKTQIMLREARRYHSLGWSIIGLLHGRKKADQKWKHYQEQRADDEQLQRWFASGDRQPAVVCGQVSGWVACRDFDQMDAYNRWAAANPVLAQALPTVATPRPGRHVYHIDGTATGRIITLDDGEYRAAGYCLLPPSTQTKGRYEWLVPLPGDGDIPEVDPVVAGLLPTQLGVDATQRDTEDTGGLRTLGSVCSASSVSSVSHSDIGIIIVRTLPHSQGHRHRKIFELARELKAVPELKNAPVADLREIVKRWHAKALPKLGTKPFEDTWFDFLEGWSRVKHAKGEGLAADLLAKAVAAGVPDCAGHYQSHELRLLVALCRELQRHSKSPTFFLGCRTAGDLLGVKHHRAARWLRGLQADGILQLVKPGDIAKRLAAEYRYLGSL